MVTRRDTSKPRPIPANVLASPTLAELYRRQGHPEMADRLLAGLDPTLSPERTPAEASPRDRRVRDLRALLARVRARRRSADGVTP